MSVNSKSRISRKNLEELHVMTSKHISEYAAVIKEWDDILQDVVARSQLTKTQLAMIRYEIITVKILVFNINRMRGQLGLEKADVPKWASLT